MNIKILNSIHDILAIILQFLVFYIFFTLLATLINNSFYNYLISLILLPCIIIGYVSSRYIKKLPLSILLFIIYFAIIFCLPLSTSIKVLIVFFSIIITSSFMKIWCNKNSTDYISVPSIAFVIIFILSGQFSNEKIQTLSYFLGIVYVFLSLIEKYLKNLIIYVYDNSDTQNLPIKQIVNINSFSLVIFTLISTVVITIARFFSLDKWVTFILTPILNILIKILGYIIGLISSTSEEVTVTPATVTPMKNMQVSPKTYTNPYIMMLLDILPRILIFIVVIFVLKKLYCFLRNNFYKSVKINDNIEYLKDSKEQSINMKIKSKLFSLSELKNISNNKKIRKLYYKKIMKFKNKKSSIFSRMTPSEITKTVINTESDSLNDLTSLYEKARYGKGDCMDSDVKKANELYSKK